MQLNSVLNLKKNATETYGMLQTAFRVVEHLIGSYLDWPKGRICWGFKGVQQEIPWEEASTGPVAFLHQKLHPCYLDQDGHQDTSLPNQTLLWLWLFLKLRYETIGEMKEAVTKVIDTLALEDFHETFPELLERYNKCIAAGKDYSEGD